MSIRTILEAAVERTVDATSGFGARSAINMTARKAILAYEEPSETSDPVMAASWLGRIVEAEAATIDGDRYPVKGKLSSVSELSCEVYRNGFIRVWYPIHLVKEEAK